MSNRKLAVLTQPARGDFLALKQDMALDRYLEAEKLRRASRRSGQKVREEADRDFADAKAVASEWAVYGSECR